MTKIHYDDTTKREVKTMDFVPETVKRTTTSIVEQIKPTHRYFCDACTGVAYTVNIKDEMPSTVTCKVCGKTQPFKRENLIKL